MKKFYILLLAMSFALTAANAQTMVRFAVDMTGVTEFNPDTDTLRVAGNFQGWTPRDASSANILTDDDGNNVYEVVLPSSMENIEFKYVINTWNPDGFNEFSGATPGTPGDCVANDNRFATVTGATFDLPVYIYNTCDISTIVSNKNVKELSGLNVNPNPVTDRAIITFDNTQSEKHEVVLLNAVGEIVQASALNASASSYELIIGNQPAGMYFVQVVSESGARATKRVVLR